MKRGPLLTVLLVIMALVVTPLAILARQQPIGRIMPGGIPDVVTAPEQNGVMDQHVDAAPAWESITPESGGYFFEEVQSIPTNQAYGWKSFVINGETYLAVANFYNDSTYNFNSKIYKWSGSSFVEVQSIPTSGASDWESFVIAGETYLAVANGYNGSTSNINSKIYKWNGSSFVEIQSIPTNGAYDWESFVINGETYLAVANGYNDSTFNINSKIYKWNGSSFVEIQSIPTNGAYDWESFVINGETYLAVANSYDGGSTYNINSKIYKWNGSSFVEVQSIPTSGASDWESFVIDGEVYLAVANSSNGSTHNINSKIYKWNGSSFVEIQSIPTNGAYDWKSFVIDGETYLAVANVHNDSTRNIDSKIYKWNGSSFVEVQSIPTNGAVDWESFTINGEAYLAVANYHNDSTCNIDSKIYKWNGPTKPTASFTGTPQTGPAPLAVKFTDQSSGQITSRLWSFGNGDTSTDQNPTCTYNAPGTYTVSLTITGPSGSDTATKNNYITVAVPPPVADFTGSPTSGSKPLTVKFTNASTGEISSYQWDFGNGDSSQEQNPSYTYATVGTYTVKLTVTGAGGSNIKERTGYITVTEPKPTADFSADPTSGVKPLNVTFTSKSSGTISSYWWDFGDGVNSSTQSPVHTYSSTGVYSVSLKVTGPGGTDTKKIDNLITVTSSTSTFTLTVAKSGTGAGVVTSVPAGINCGSDCTEDFNADVSVTLKAKADNGSVFKGWSGGPCSGTGNCVVKMTQNIGVTARFDSKSSNKPDLMMTAFSSPVTAVVGQTVQMPNTVKNQGKASAGPFTIGIYLSKDKVINPTSDTLLQSRDRVGLGAGQSSTAVTIFKIPANITAGTYYIGAMADTRSAVDESNEANNTRLAPKMIKIVSPLPDLIVTEVSGPITAGLGQTIEVFDTIKNAGKSNAQDAFSINLYLSIDAKINVLNDIYIGSHGLAGLSIGQTARRKIEVTIPSDMEPGIYYLGASADSEDTILESNENNNSKSSIATIEIKK